MTETYYFTYGTESQPYYGGWTEVRAPNRHMACEAFRFFHPDKTKSLLNCCSVYTSEEFNRTEMAGPNGNFGFRAHEIIELSITRTDGDGNAF